MLELNSRVDAGTMTGQIHMADLEYSFHDEINYRALSTPTCMMQDLYLGTYVVSVPTGLSVPEVRQS